MQNIQLQKSFEKLYKGLQDYANNNPKENMPNYLDYADAINEMVAIIKLDY